MNQIIDILDNIEKEYIENYNQNNFNDNTNIIDNVILYENKIKRKITSLKKMFKMFSPILCVSCQEYKHRNSYYSQGQHGDKICKECKLKNKNKKNKQEQILDIDIKQLHNVYLQFHRYLYTKNLKINQYIKLIHKLGEQANISDIKQITKLPENKNDIECLSNKLHSYYTQQFSNESERKVVYSRFYQFFTKVNEKLEYRNDKEIHDQDRFEQFLLQYKNKVLGE